jgi:hypothetical protein
MTTNQIILTLLILITTCFILSQCDDVENQNQREERFGALQSLYSNDGIQDLDLTVSDGYFDPYKYWRSVPWNLPTRNLNEMSFYPFLYENYIDRYGVVYPYW